MVLSDFVYFTGMEYLLYKNLIAIPGNSSFQGRIYAENLLAPGLSFNGLQCIGERM